MNVFSKKVLFLGYGKKETSLINELKKVGCSVDFEKSAYFNTSGYDLIISFGYKHIIKEEIILDFKYPIINLHISYLPWNRGSHPNFWSFYDSTPSGVTIHLIDGGIDTGPILYQKYVDFDNNELTFKDTYERLKKEIEKLFIKNINNIINGNYVSKMQTGKGSFHNKKQLPSEFKGWDSNINEEIIRLKNKKLKIISKKS